MVKDGDFTQYREMLLMLFVANACCSIVKSIKGLHPLFDSTHKATFSDSAAPIGYSLILGSFLFGMGMQLGNGCASGTLIGLGEGFVKSYIVLPFFIIGATLAATDSWYNWWSNLPKTKTTVQIDFGFILLILLTLYILTYIADYIRAKRKLADPEGRIGSEFGNMRRLFTIDPLGDNADEPNKSKWYKSTLVAVALGITVAFFYMCVGSMIGVMGVFPKIGGVVLKIFGKDVNQWKYFKDFGALPKSLLDLVIFNSDVFMALGAFLASTIARNFGTSQKNSVVEIIKGIIGGLLMGIGARFSSGCNIGSMLSGITSSSLHGFVWMFCAILGSLVVCQTTKYIENREKGLNTYTPIK